MRWESLGNISEILTAQIARYLLLKWRKQVFHHITGLDCLTLNPLNLNFYTVNRVLQYFEFIFLKLDFDVQNHFFYFE